MTRWLTIGAVCLFSLLSGSARAADSSESDLSAFAQQAAGCPAEAKHCFGLKLHVVVKEDGAPVQTPEWFAHQLSQVNRHFARIGVGFHVVDVAPLPSRFETIVSRRDRDRLGRSRFSRKVLHCFLVGHLHNVDSPGEIRGVHWRDRAKRQNRWVVLASIAPEWVLAHEIGHFFGLPHSKFADSIMNKTPRGLPWPQRSFNASEVLKMAKRLPKYLKSRRLVAIPRENK